MKELDQSSPQITAKKAETQLYFLWAQFVNDKDFEIAYGIVKSAALLNNCDEEEVHRRYIRRYEAAKHR